jgi:hypothetical protein
MGFLTFGACFCAAETRFFLAFRENANVAQTVFDAEPYCTRSAADAAFDQAAEMYRSTVIAAFSKRRRQPAERCNPTRKL